MECRHEIYAAFLQQKIVETILQRKRKPYLPIWGELYLNLREIAKVADILQRDIVLYQLNPTGQVKYEYAAKKIKVEISELLIFISLTAEEFLESLSEGRFPPRQP